MKFLILTTDPTAPSWGTIESKLMAISGALKVWEVDIEYVETRPLVTNQRVSSFWLKTLIEPYFKKGWDVVALHMSDAQRKSWGIKPTLRGSNPVTNDEIGDFYFWADEDTDNRGHSQFVMTCLHEFCHEYYSETNLPDITHQYHDEHKEVASLVETFDWNLYQPRRMALKTTKNLLERIVGLYKRYLAFSHPKGLQPCVARALDRVLMDMAEKGYPMKLVEGYRTPERQAELYAQGRTKPGKVVTNARAGESFHNYGVAADCVFVKEGYNAPERLWQIYGNVAARHGFTWGGVWDLKDYPHIEMTKGYSFTDFQQGRVDISKFD